jgi:hypothetical protein
MPNGHTTKKIRGTDLSAKHFLYTGGQRHPKFWLLPVFDPTSSEKTKQLIERNLDCWEEITRNIPLEEHRKLRLELEGAAQSYGITIERKPCIVTEEEMRMLLTERGATRTLDEIDSLYEF